MSEKPISTFINRHFHHFNSATLKDSANAYVTHIRQGNPMLMTIAGAMSTAGIGISLSEMIRQKAVHAICCTGANLEEEIFKLVAHNEYERIPDYRSLSPKDERALLERGLNRVTDTCIPEESAFRKIEAIILQEWKKADTTKEQYFPHEFIFEILRNGSLEKHYQADPNDCWLLAAIENEIPLFIPGWEDSTLGNMYAAACIRGDIKNTDTVRGGIEYMLSLSKWYQEMTKDSKSVGFFQIGGGIAGDFPICVVPMLKQDLCIEETPAWGYFSQISDSTTSYGSYSGAVPNEKITWGKLEIDTPKFIIESDATIVAPLMFSYILENYGA